MKIKNKDLVHVINFIDGLTVKGLKSIHRTNISAKLKEKLEKENKEMRQELKKIKGVA